MNRTTPLLLAIAALLATVGAFFAAGHGSDDRGLWWVSRHLEVLQDQLAALKGQLLEYKQVHGRYPTNDEGLAVLDRFEAKMPFMLGRRPGAADELPGASYSDAVWLNRKRTVQLYKAQRRDDPEGAALTLTMSLAGQPKDWGETSFLSEHDVVEATLAIDERDQIFILSPAGILSPWWLPYTYENRIGLDAAKFEGSSVDRDREGRYSIRVDEGIYVCAVDGMVWTAEVDGRWWEWNLPRFLGGLLLLIAVIFLIASVIRSRKGASVLGGVRAPCVGRRGFWVWHDAPCDVLYHVAAFRPADAPDGRPPEGTSGRLPLAGRDLGCGVSTVGGRFGGAGDDASGECSRWVASRGWSRRGRQNIRAGLAQ